MLPGWSAATDADEITRDAYAYTVICMRAGEHTFSRVVRALTKLSKQNAHRSTERRASHSAILRSSLPSDTVTLHTQTTEPRAPAEHAAGVTFLRPAGASRECVSGVPLHVTFRTPHFTSLTVAYSRVRTVPMGFTSPRVTSHGGARSASRRVCATTRNAQRRGGHTRRRIKRLRMIWTNDARPGRRSRWRARPE